MLDPTMSSTPRLPIALIALALLITGASCSGKPPGSPARRVILISCDTLRPDHLGVYGYSRDTSPGLDAFASDALVFDNAWCSAPWTGPSLSSLLSGLLPDEIGVPGGNKFPMPPEVVTMAELARDAGFSTAAVVSNWVLRRPDASMGDAGVQQGFQTFDDQMKTKEENRPNFERRAPDTTYAAIRWLEQHTKPGDDRFFLWVHYQDPHGPYMPPPEYEKRFERPLTSEAEIARGGTNSGKGQVPLYQLLHEEQRPEPYRIRYDGEIRFFDDQFARLVEWLKANDLYKDSLIVFTSDHGESLGEHGYWFCHGENVYREETRVPMIVRFPDGSRRTASERTGRYARVGAFVGHLDLWPTVLEALGLKGEANRGVSLFSESIPDGRINTQVFGAQGKMNRWSAITDGKYRLITQGKEPPRLFDLATDPGEMHDIAAAHPDVVKSLVERHQAFLAQHARAPLQGSEMKLDAKGKKAMDGLGYTDGDGH